jgi:hypothetical protein
MPKEINMQANFFAKIPNNDEGRYFLFLLDKYLNKKSYVVKKRGRWPNHELIQAEVAEGKLHKDTRFWQRVPEKYAQAFNLYLCAKVKGHSPEAIGISTCIAEHKWWKELDEQRALTRMLQARVNELEVQLSTMQTSVSIDFDEIIEMAAESKNSSNSIDLGPRYQHLEKR